MKKWDWILEYVPRNLVHEVSLAIAARSTPISEMRFRTVGKCTVSFSDERIALSSRPAPDELSRLLKEMSGGAMWSARESIRSGYITLRDGVRVGICAEARYDGGGFVGIGEPTSLIFRIPSSGSENISELYSAWREVRRGMIIYSPPGIGKTAALRSLIPMIASGRDSLNVAVVDERGELCLQEDGTLSVDMYRGYKRRDGVEIALRTAGADVIAIDEIGGEDEARSLLGFLNSGVRILATAHAGELSELKRRISLAPLLENLVFDVAVGISLCSGKRKITVSRLDI